MTRTFRFGAVAAPARAAEDWISLACRIEAMGYATLLTPDNLDSLAPVPALTTVSAATQSLRLGTFVLAPVRPPEYVAWEAATADVLTDGRFELGLGTGRPVAAESDAQRLGVPFGSLASRRQHLAATISAVRERAADLPILVAGSGPSLLSLAAREADVVAFGIPPIAGEAVLEEKVEIVRREAGGRFDRLELSVNVSIVGDEVPAWFEQVMGVTGDQLVAAEAVALLRGSVDEMCDLLLRRRDRLGISYVTVNSAYAEAFAPVVERLAGR